MPDETPKSQPQTTPQPKAETTTKSAAKKAEKEVEAEATELFDQDKPGFEQTDEQTADPSHIPNG